MCSEIRQVSNTAPSPHNTPFCCTPPLMDGKVFGGLGYQDFCYWDIHNYIESPSWIWKSRPLFSSWCYFLVQTGRLPLKKKKTHYFLKNPTKHNPCMRDKSLIQEECRPYLEWTPKDQVHEKSKVSSHISRAISDVLSQPSYEGPKVSRVVESRFTLTGVSASENKEFGNKWLLW